MRRVIRNTYSGSVCEREVYDISELTRNIKAARIPKPRFQNEEEREQHKLGISRRRHARLVNANFSPTSLYSTLTFSNEYEVHTFEEAKRIRDNFVRRLKYAYPKARIMAYLGRGKSTNRIHMQTCVTHSDGHTTLNRTPKVTGKGQVYLLNKILDRKVEQTTL